jgi:hypothetical protein
MWRQGGLYPGYPASTQTWQYLSNNLVGVTFTVLFREEDGLLRIWPSVGGDISINMVYRSRGWVRVGFDIDQVFKDNVALASDWIMHDPLLIGRYLKLKFLESLGFDTQSAKDNFNIVLEARSAKDNSAPVLSAAIHGPSFRLLDNANAPETGYGE